MYKSIGKRSLSFTEFEDVLLDVETVLNNRSLSYIEDENEKQILTSNTLIHGEDIILPHKDIEVLDEENPLRRRLAYIQVARRLHGKMGRRVRTFTQRERHSMKHKSQSLTPSVGDVVMIKRESKNRGNWKIRLVIKIFQSKNNAIRLKTKNGQLERAVGTNDIDSDSNDTKKDCDCELS